MNMVIFPWQTITYSNQKFYINVPIKTLKPHNTDLMLTEENHGKPLFSESSQEIHSLYPPTVMMGKISFSWWIAIFHHVWLLNHMCFTHSGWWFEPLCKIWVRQLGSWHSQYMENHKSHVPVTTKQHLNHFWVPSGNLTVRYWKWWFSSWIFPLKMVDLSIVM
jgi:hypothetical protein